MRTQLYAAACWLHTSCACVWTQLSERENKVIWKEKKHLISKRERAKEVSVSVFKKRKGLCLRGGGDKIETEGWGGKCLHFTPKSQTFTLLSQTALALRLCVDAVYTWKPHVCPHLYFQVVLMKITTDMQKQKESVFPPLPVCKQTLTSQPTSGDKRARHGCLARYHRDCFWIHADACWEIDINADNKDNTCALWSAIMASKTSCLFNFTATQPPTTRVISLCSKYFYAFRLLRASHSVSQWMVVTMWSPYAFKQSGLFETF